MKKQKTNIKSKKSWWQQAISKDAGIFIKISRTSLLTFTLLFGGFTSISYFSNSRTLTDSEDKLLKDMGFLLLIHKRCEFTGLLPLIVF